MQGTSAHYNITLKPIRTALAALRVPSVRVFLYWTFILERSPGHIGCDYELFTTHYNSSIRSLLRSLPKMAGNDQFALLLPGGWHWVVCLENLHDGHCLMSFKRFDHGITVDSPICQFSTNHLPNKGDIASARMQALHLGTLARIETRGLLPPLLQQTKLDLSLPPWVLSRPPVITGNRVFDGMKRVCQLARSGHSTIDAFCVTSAGFGAPEKMRRS